MEATAPIPTIQELARDWVMPWSLGRKAKEPAATTTAHSDCRAPQATTSQARVDTAIPSTHSAEAAMAEIQAVLPVARSTSEPRIGASSTGGSRFARTTPVTHHETARREADSRSRT